jgi:hypothetical protein
MSRDDHISMRNNHPDPESELEQMQSSPEDNILANIENDETSVMVFKEPDSDLLFLSMDNVTIHMTENAFYTLVKATQESAKRLLNLE